MGRVSERRATSRKLARRNEEASPLNANTGGIGDFLGYTRLLKQAVCFDSLQQH